MRKVTVLAALALVLCASAGARALDLRVGPSAQIFAEFKPVVGAWAEYLVTAKGEKPVTMRLAVVAKEGEAFWYEVVVPMGEDGDMVTKMLVAGDPQNPESVQRMIMKMGDQPAMELPTEMPEGAEGEEFELPKSEFQELGVETIVVPAGTFEAKHIRVTQEKTVGDVWLSAGAGPYGMVKTTSEDIEMVLTALGSDAKSLITETPVPFGIQGMSFGMPKGQ
jgi:hypothetical protein